PSLTIAALADRAVERLLERPRPRRTLAAAAGAAEIAGPPPPSAGSGTSFTEQMKGFVALGETDPVRGWEQGRLLTQRFMFELTITVPDVERFLASDDREGVAEGYVDCDLLGGELPVKRGWFNLFVATDDAATREMRYRLWFSDLSGTPLTMYGYKEVRNDPGLDLWTDTSTLYITLLRGHVPPGAEGEVAGAGVLRILPQDFARQLTTFRGSGEGSLKAVAGFGAFFVKSLRDIYLKPSPQPDRSEPS
ncbi:MAG: hypothetical protein QM628_06990, partial [Propionicimonas sp.]